MEPSAELESYYASHYLPDGSWTDHQLGYQYNMLMELLGRTRANGRLPYSERILGGLAQLYPERVRHLVSDWKQHTPWFQTERVEGGLYLRSGKRWL